MRKHLLAGLAALLVGSIAHAAEIKVLSGNGAKGAVTKLVQEFERASGHRVSIHFYVKARCSGGQESGSR